MCFKSDREDEVLLVSSSRHPDQWIVPGGGMEPEEEPDGAAIREVYEEAGVKGKLGRLLGVFEHNQDRKHRTYVYVLIVTETVDDWEDSITIGSAGGSRSKMPSKCCRITNRSMQSTYSDSPLLPVVPPAVPAVFTPMTTALFLQ